VINQEELAVCRKRGHDTALLGTYSWEQCIACGMWLRYVESLEESTDAPPKVDVGQTTASSAVDHAELAICKRRGTHLTTRNNDWDQCEWCHTWLRRVTRLEESEDAPADSHRGRGAQAEMARRTRMEGK
jgi:hypothetical protein